MGQSCSNLQFFETVASLLKSVAVEGEQRQGYMGKKVSGRLSTDRCLGQFYVYRQMRACHEEWDGNLATLVDARPENSAKPLRALENHDVSTTCERNCCSVYLG